MNRRKYYAVFNTVKTLHYGKPSQGGPVQKIEIPITGKRLPATREEVREFKAEYFRKFLLNDKPIPKLKNRNYALVGYRYGMDGALNDSNGEDNEIVK